MRKTLAGISLSGSLLGAVLGLCACPGNNTSGMDMGYPDMSGPGVDMTVAGPVLKGPSKSGTMAIADDDSVVAVVNSENDSVSFFVAASNMKLATVTTGKAPAAVVIAPDKTTAYVANRADATVVKVTGINTMTPAVSAAIAVGSEPTGLALSPTGANLFVAEFAESSIGVITTSSMTRATFVSNVRNPRAIAVTNNGSGNDNNETVIVPEFYGAPQPGGEGKNDGRKGMVHLYKVADASEQGPLVFNPFINAMPGTGFEMITAPNQLYAVGIANGRIFVPSVSASPGLPLKSDSNVYPVVYVGDLTSKMQVVGGNGTINLAEPVFALPLPRWFLAEMVDIAFFGTTNIAYIVSRGADVVQRVDFGAAPPAIGSPQNKQIDVLGAGATACQNPTGIVIATSLNKAFVNCWVTRRVAVLDLTSQTVATVIDSVTPSGALTAQDRGRRFYFTGRGRWSGNGTAMMDATENGSAWSSCGSCHPDGLSDNITWIFNSGPRQTTSMDGTFSHSPGGGVQKQRILNWTAINDELHDFEGNTRGVSGGKGAIVTSNNCPAMPGMLATEMRSAIPAAGLDNLGGLVNKEIQDNPATNCVKDFDDITAWVKTIRPPRGRQFLDQNSVMRGAMLFSTAQGGCTKCHGGVGWTISNLFYMPKGATNNATMGVNSLRGTAFTGAGQAYSAFASPNVNQIAAQAMTADASVPAAIPPLQLSCSLRIVGTFGIPMDMAATTALEVRNGTFVAGMGTSNRAQGLGGYNVPSLYGLQLGAPYLHHGQAATLGALFGDPYWKTHWQAGNPNFLTGATAAQDRTDLINFLLSIDSNTTEQAVPPGFAGGCVCPMGAANC